MDFIVNLFNSNPILAIILGLIVITVIFSIIRGLIKLALVLVVIAVAAVLFFDVNPDTVIETGKEVIQTSNDYYKDTLKPIVEKELSGATYTESKDGSFIVKTKNLSIEGTNGGSTVIITYKDKSTKVEMSQLGSQFKDFIEKNSSQN